MFTVLLVDDHAIIRQFLAKILGRAGIRSLEAADGQDAFALARAEKPDVVISDILMPTMDGYEFVQRLRADSDLAPTPVIFHTGTYGTSEARQLAEACGVSVILPKPCEPQQLLDAISEVSGTRITSRGKPPVAFAGGTSSSQLTGNAFAEYAGALHAARRHLDKVVERIEPLWERQALRNVSAVFAEQLGQLRQLGGRFHALVELALDMGAQRDPSLALRQLFDVARQMIPADYVALGLHPATNPAQRQAFAYAVSTRWYTDAEADAGLPQLLAPVVASRCSLRRSSVGTLPAAGLPPEHPPVGSFLAVSLASRHDIYGWMYFANRPGAVEFSDEDEHVAATLCAVGAMLYEKAALYEVIQRHAARLQLEATERQRAEARIAKLARIQAVLSGINGLIVRVRSRAELFQEACRIAVEQGGFRLAWVALLRGEEAAPVAHFGGDAGLMQTLAISTRPGGPNSTGPTARAMRENQPCVVNDIAAGPEPASDLLAATQSLGVRAFSAHPLTVKGRVVGCLGLYAAEPGFFDEQELHLLDELARDISYAMEFILREEQLDHLAIYDPLTQLPNRTLLLQRLNGFVQAAREQTTRFAVLMLDVERFKAFNDALGHAGGDELLKHIAERLKYLAGGASFMARIAGDRFAVVVPAIAVDADIDAVVQAKDWTGLGEPIHVGSQEIGVSLKVGFAVFPEDAAEPEDLLRSAELALKQGRSWSRRYTRYTRDMATASAQALKLEARLRKALKRRDFLLHYQPKVDLRTGAICGAEALLRWQDHDEGLVLPSIFIPLLEETGLILDVGRWVLEQAAADHDAWIRAGLAPPRVSVNVSQVQLAHPHFVRDVLATLSERPRSSCDIELELTESLLMSDVDSAVDKLRQLRDAGISVVMDDFGTGYSSLAYLARLPLNAVKIDRSFIKGITQDADTRTIAAAITSMAHSMNLRVVAEGVETSGQLALLRQLECDELQGALFSMPVPAAQFADMLRSGRTLSQAIDEQRHLPNDQA